MDISMLNAAGNRSRLKVSFTARLIAGLCFHDLGDRRGAGSLLLINLVRLLRANEGARISVVMNGMKEALFAC